jgi:MOSC domain-containing protein YiiM
MTKGSVASLHFHPAVAGEPMLATDAFSVVAEKGIEKNGEGRLFERGSKRQVSLIEREQLAEHANALGHPGFAPGDVRSNIETEGIDLISLKGKQIQIGEAVLLLYEARTPCWKMDELIVGLRARMEEERQGMLAQVISGGIIRAGDPILPVD